MREIKFRAFIKRPCNKMANIQMLEMQGDGHYAVRVDRGKLESSDKKGYVNIFSSKSKDDPRFEIMQYTGLKDKYGVEIYERDIIVDTTTNECFEVYFDENIAMFGVKNNQTTIFFPMPRHDDLKYFEVIGNIYENPELLKD